MTPLPSNIAELQDLAQRIQEDAEAVRTEARDKLDARRESIRTHLSDLIDEHGFRHPRVATYYLTAAEEFAA